MTSLIPCLKFTVNFYCDAAFSWVNLVNVDASTRSNSKLSLCVTHSRYIRRRVWEMILCLTCFQVFYSLAYITQSDTFKRKFPSFSCSQENKPMSHLYFHQIESGVEYFTFFGSKFTIFLDVTGKVYQLSVLCHMYLFCDTVFSQMHSVIVNASTWSNTKLSPCSTHPRHISEHSFWDMTCCIKCIQPLFKRKVTLMLSLNQINV